MPELEAGAEGTQPLRCLVLSDGRRGIENQALGLAESCAALRDLTLQKFVISHSKPFAALSPRAQMRVTSLNLPECDLVIGCGRQAIAPLLQLKQDRPEVFTVYVQDPRMATGGFDLVFAPEHDEISGETVISIIGSPNRVTSTKIIGETLSFAEGLKKFSMPRAALLIGGTSKTHKLDAQAHAKHLEAAKTLLAAGLSLLVTTSRRTPDFALTDWQRLASDHDEVWLHSDDGPNPYFAFLGGADFILVTEDSTNMLTEACGTGKPVFRLPMTPKSKSKQAGKFEHLYAALETRCGVTTYSGQTKGLDYTPLNETSRAAALLWERFDKS